MRGRKLQHKAQAPVFPIKKESPNEGTETKKERDEWVDRNAIKKESPNEGTETTRCTDVLSIFHAYKKRIPE